MSKDIYETVTVEAAKTGWILTRKGQPKEIFVRWEALVLRLNLLLTSGGEKGDE